MDEYAERVIKRQGDEAMAKCDPVEKGISKDMLEQILKIIECFNFEKVRNMMLAVDWKWRNHKYGYVEVPSVSTIIEVALEHLFRVAGEDIDDSTSGGLIAENDDGLLSLEFIGDEAYGKY